MTRAELQEAVGHLRDCPYSDDECPEYHGPMMGVCISLAEAVLEAKPAGRDLAGHHIAGNFILSPLDD